ncbi:peptide/nickel transport system ATP-binding protein/oligopeptide transport system ATP-binding protein [Sinosporangium album]|uniref:Peptide/nickel transport system ATP-binding protein/oligopeptide transport system ATP-binding protein n=1 Tax=Sinosporangium album TaxID=504805 RepID=A0A1G7QQ10_9ACTN|nr:ABC transporter ATP-binding protein [Sinosporangium album]SDG00554.1 peptide/nickel transport system ATP-binding protein/oligopeptide transport system ATP-binding protein [Sinosporangium album]
MPLLEVQDLRTEFRAAQGSVTAVDGVSFSVDAGEMVALVGESGCGKSATAQSIMGLIVPPVGQVTGGKVLFEGRDLLTMKAGELRAVRGKGIAMIFQDPMTSLNPVLTIGKQLTESLRLHLGLSGRAARARAVELLEMVRIPAPETRLSSYPHQLSGGMRQRVMIAMALSCEPRLILADEITTALDVTIQAQILDLLRDLAAETGTAVLFITHDLGVVAGMAERVNVMYAGQIVERADTVELFHRPQMPYTWGLLGSVPRLDQVRGGKLRPIAGQPPELSAMPPGCRFGPRCTHARDVCVESSPALTPVRGGVDDVQLTRCWGMQDVPEGGWLSLKDRYADQLNQEK